MLPAVFPICFHRVLPAEFLVADSGFQPWNRVSRLLQAGAVESGDGSQLLCDCRCNTIHKHAAHHALRFHVHLKGQ